MDAEEMTRHRTDVPGHEPSGVKGLWLNKREFSIVEVPFRHVIAADHGGWRLIALEAGKLVARGRGAPTRIDMEEGDELLSSGNDFYVTLARQPSAEPEPEPAPARKSSRKRA